MIKVLSKFKPGDKVYTLIQEPIIKTCKCDLCEGTGEVEHRGVLLRCPQCKGNKETTYATNYRCWAVIEKPLHITSISIKYHSDVNYIVRYNVSGYKRSQDNTFFTKEDAIARCNELNAALPEKECILPKAAIGFDFSLETKFNIGDKVFMVSKKEPRNPKSELVPIETSKRIDEIRATIYSDENCDVRYKLEGYNRREGNLFLTLEDAIERCSEHNRLLDDEDK